MPANLSCVNRLNTKKARKCRTELYENSFQTFKENSNSLHKEKNENSKILDNTVQLPGSQFSQVNIWHNKLHPWSL